ncbi:MAG: hypothetical protein PVJ38_02415 [Candidatus Bathyarchaeota archaeon]|jgi:hypothetical protein
MAETEKGYAYTPGLQVTRSITLRKRRILPLFGEILVEEGDYVDYDTVVARAYEPGEPELINAAPMLGVSKENLTDYVVKEVGDELKEGEVIAQYFMLFGLIKRYIRAPFDCTLESVSQYSGRIVVRGKPIPIEVRAYMSGKIVEIIPREGVVIEREVSFIQGIFGIGGETFGELHLAVETPEDPLTENSLSPQYKGKIVIGGSYTTSDALKRAVEIGVRGIVTGSVKSSDIKDFLGYEIGVAITGEEDCGITMIATESFGEMPMAHHTFNLFKTLEGKIASINGSTQIRAGVVRPEVIAPPIKVDSAEGSGDELGAGMTTGTRIRAIRAPYFGKLGVVSGLPSDPEKLETESKARVLTVKFDDGSQATIPRANVEIIVER